MTTGGSVTGQLNVKLQSRKGWGETGFTDSVFNLSVVHKYVSVFRVTVCPERQCVAPYGMTSDSAQNSFCFSPCGVLVTVCQATMEWLHCYQHSS